MKIQKKNYFFFGGGGGRWGVGGRGRGQGGCERRIEVFCENSKKKNLGGGVGGVSGRGRVWGGGVRVDVNEIEVFVKIQKKIFLGGGGSVGGRGRVGGSEWM